MRTHAQASGGAAVQPRETLGRSSALAGLAVGAYMSALDGSIINSMLPVVTRALGSDVATMEWIVTTYVLLQSGLLLSFGRLGDLRGHKVVYVLGFVIFLVGSVFCGLAPSPPFLIGARAIQALGAAALWSNSAAILTRVFPPEQRGRALGFQATMVYLGLSSGPPLGGWLTGAFGWRAVFLVNIPFGLLALYLSVRYIRRDEPSGRGERFDLAGAAVYLLGLVSVLLALNQGHALGWTSAPVLGSLAIGLALLVAFAAIERRVAHPMLDLGLFRRRAFAAPVLSAVMNYLCTNSTIFLMPFYLIQGRGLDPAQAGLILIGQPVVMATTTSLSGALSDKIGSRLPATLGMTILSLGLFLLSRLDGSSPLPQVVGSLAVVGLGVGLFTSPNSSAVMGAVPSERRGVAAGILSTARTLGGVLGIGLAGAIFTTVLTSAGDAAPATVVHAANIGLATASGIALLGALTSATRPALDQSGGRPRRL